MAWPSSAHASTSAKIGSMFMIAELPTTPRRGSTVNRIVNAVPYRKVSASSPHHPGAACGRAKPPCEATPASATSAATDIVVAVRTRPSSVPASCCVSTSTMPKVAAAASAKATPMPMRPHCPTTPRPEAAPSTSSASARPSSITGIARSTRGSGRWR